jgi:hypothetical protein
MPRNPLFFCSLALVALAVPVAGAAQTSPAPSVSPTTMGSSSPSSMPSSLPRMTAMTMMPSCHHDDPLVWVDPKTKTYYVKGSSKYGQGKSGNYACKSVAVAAGDQPVKSGMGPAGTTIARPMSGTAGSGIETNQMPNSTSSSSPSP